MTARELIDSIFMRAQAGAEPNTRRITGDQFRYLRDLILADPESGRIRNGQGGSIVWTPAGRHKYVLVEPRGRMGSLTRLSAIDASETGTLF